MISVFALEKCRDTQFKEFINRKLFSGWGAPEGHYFDAQNLSYKR